MAFTTFTAGTKAKASEVNDNFTYTTTYCDTNTEWFPIETLTYAAETTKTTTGTLPVYKTYKVTYDNMQTSGADILNIRVNGISTSSYNYIGLNSTTLSTGTATQYALGVIAAVDSTSGELIISGKSAAISNGQITFNGSNVSGAIGSTGMLGGSLPLGNAVQVTSFSIYSGGGANLTGQVRIWGRN